MTIPISPIPDRQSDEKLIEQARSELHWKEYGIDSLKKALEYTLDHESQPEHLSAVFDWAAEMRRAGMDWSEAIEAAMIFYYG